MGKVHQAVSPEGASVAIKTMILRDGLDARARWETVERFQREARAARSLVHKNIVQVLDIGADQDTFFIVMEYVEGQTVRELIRLAGAIGTQRATEIVGSVCEALAYAHDLGIIHRDIKPDNIMITSGGAVKLMDFGLAAILTEKGVTQTGTMMGTLAYMSPEQARGEKLDARSDIFSLGSTFYEMLAGRPPFSGEGTAAVLTKIVSEEPEQLSGLPPYVSRTLSRCMRKQPEYRFQSAREVAASLQPGGAAAQATGTAVIPGRVPTPTPVPVAAPGVGTVLSRGADQTPLPDFRCSKCGERMNRKVATCWKCGAPNTLMVQRTQDARRRQEIEQALGPLMQPGKKPPRGKR
jgi:serine/threonine protein kinase